MAKPSGARDRDRCRGLATRRNQYRLALAMGLPVKNSNGEPTWGRLEDFAGDGAAAAGHPRRPVL
jgi:hypothetical protein